MIHDPLLLNDWHPVATRRQLAAQPIHPVRLLGEELVLWQADGAVAAWQDLCLHRGTRLSLGKVRGATLACPYHGWVYNTAGRCIHIPAHPEQTPPAKAQVRCYQVQERYGLIWVCLGEPAGDPPPFPEADDEAFRQVLCGPYWVNASGPRVVENFLDVGHFPFVHAGILGDERYPTIDDYTAQITAEGVVARGVRIYQPDGYGTGQGAVVTYTYRALRPLTAYLRKESTGPTLAILLMVTPHDTLTSTMWMIMALNYSHDTPEAELVAFQDRIVAQDLPIVESQRPELLPLDLQAELHLRSDRTAIAYRQWLAQLGLSFGTA